jgi:hypothetical protein
MTDVYGSRESVFIQGIVFPVTIYLLWQKAASADSAPWLLGLAFVMFAIFLSTAIGAYVFPSWGYDENSIQKYGFFSFNPVKKFGWNQIAGIHFRTIRGSGPRFYIEMVDGTSLDFAKETFSDNGIFADLVRLARQHNPNVNIDDKVLKIAGAL